jgi:hypothetical protein
VYLYICLEATSHRRVPSLTPVVGADAILAI